MSPILFEFDTEVHDGLAVWGFAVSGKCIIGLDSILNIL